MDINALRPVVVSIAGSNPIQNVLNLIVTELAQHRDVALVRIWLRRPGDVCAWCRMRSDCPDQTECLHLMASAGQPTDPADDWSRVNGDFRRFPLNVRKIGRIGATGEPLLIQDLSSDAAWIARPEWAKREHLRSFAGRPLTFGGEILGVLGIFSRAPFEQRTWSHLEIFADQAAVAIANARAFEQIEQLREALAQENARLVGELVERERVEAALRESEQQFRSVAQSATDAIITADQTGRILFWNRAAQAMFGYADADAVGEPLTLIMPERLREAHRNGLMQFVSTGEGRVIGKTVELTALRKNGEEFPVELSLGTWASGGTKFFSGIVRDVTARTQLELQLRHSQKMEAIGQLAGGIAHDFNNLLTSILGYCELLRTQIASGDPLLADLAEIEKAGTSAASLTRQLLAFSRKQIMDPVVLGLNDVLATIERMLRRLIGEDIAMELRLDADLGPVKVDPSQIEQIVLNLSVNARDAMPEGGTLTIETKNVQLDGSAGRPLAPGPYVMLAVSDTGHGMTPDVQAHVFEPFFTTKEEGKGTGLGLATVYGIVRQSGGHIWVYSEQGQGTTFKIYLPRVAEAPSAHVSPAHAPLVGTETILLVEDDPGVRDLTRRMLMRSGYTVLCGDSPDRAFEISQHHDGPIHLLLTDIVMPKMSGLSLALRLRADRPELHVLYMSGYTDEAVVRRGVLATSASFVQKPFTTEALVTKIGEALATPRGADAT